MLVRAMVLRTQKYRLANKFAPTIEMRSNRRSALARDGDVMVTRNESGSTRFLGKCMYGPSQDQLGARGIWFVLTDAIAGKRAPTVEMRCSRRTGRLSGRLARSLLILILGAPSNHAGRNSILIRRVNRQGCRFSRAGPGMALRGGPPNQCRITGMPSLGEGPSGGARALWLLSRSSKVTRCKSGTVSGRYRRNGYVHQRTTIITETESDPAHPPSPEHPAQQSPPAYHPQPPPHPAPDPNSCAGCWTDPRA